MRFSTVCKVGASIGEEGEESKERQSEGVANHHRELSECWRETVKQVALFSPSCLTVVVEAY